VCSQTTSISVGACAMQNIDGCERPVAYFSQKLLPNQMKWSTIEREAFTIICALRKRHAIIFGSHIVIYFDHNPLTCVVQCVPKSTRLMGWAHALQQYDFELRYKTGKCNMAADCLSRIT